MSGPKNALAQWGVSALRPVQLPSGMKALIKLPDITELLRSEQFPQDLRDMASKYATTGIDMAALQGDEIIRFLRFTYDLIARSLKYLAPPDSEAWDAFQSTGDSPTEEGWQVVALTGSEVAEMDVDQADIEALGKLMARQATPNEITAQYRVDHGLLDPKELADVVAEAQGGRVSDFATFRRQPGGAVDGSDGEDIRPTAVPATRGRRSGRGVRAGRGTRT